MHWRKSSHSGGVNDEQCVELGSLAQGVGIRDSKSPRSGVLSLTAAEFRALAEAIEWLGQER
ncbi:DUF397 domain-containing protein [Spirillospora sp. NPDC052269]